MAVQKNGVSTRGASQSRKRGVIRIKKITRTVTDAARSFVGVPTSKQVKREFKKLAEEYPFLWDNHKICLKQGKDHAKEYQRTVVVHGHKVAPDPKGAGFKPVTYSGFKN